MHPAALTAALKVEALRLGFDLAGATLADTPPTFGFLQQWFAENYCGRMHYLAERLEAYRDPNRLLDRVRGVLMLAVNYRSIDPVPAKPGQATVSRYAWGTDYHEVIRRRLRELAESHQRLVPTARVRGVVDTAPLLERDFAQHAGLGWIGKNTLLINQRYGSWVFLAALLTTAELSPDEAAAPGKCGSCRACLDACPTGALLAPYRLDARKCISYLTIESRAEIPEEYRAACGDRIFGCDACQAACPWNQHTPATHELALYPKPGMNPVELADLSTLDEAEFRRRFRHTPLWRARLAGILRNAAVVAENQKQNDHGSIDPP